MELKILLLRSFNFGNSLMQIATFKVESNNKKNKKNVVELYLFLFLFFDEMEVIKIDAKRDFQNKANTKYKFVLSILKNRKNREMVRTTKIRTSKTKKISETSVDDQNIEKIN